MQPQPFLYKIRRSYIKKPRDPSPSKEADKSSFTSGQDVFSEVRKNFAEKE